MDQTTQHVRVKRRPPREVQREYERRYRASEKCRATKRRYIGLPEPTRPCPEQCELCGRKQSIKGLALDHDHETGVFRGWLCIPCNTGIGKLGDNLEGVLRAADYLKRNTLTSPGRPSES